MSSPCLLHIISASPPCHLHVTSTSSPLHLNVISVSPPHHLTLPSKHLHSDYLLELHSEDPLLRWNKILQISSSRFELGGHKEVCSSIYEGLHIKNSEIPIIYVYGEKSEARTKPKIPLSPLKLSQIRY